MSKKESEKYLNKAQHNQKLANFLEAQGEDGFPDWVITASFYVGLHWLCAWLSDQGRPRNSWHSHGDMRRLINPEARGEKPSGYIPVNKRTYNAYIELYDLSITSRYDGFLDEATMKEFEQLEIQNAKEALIIIRQFIEGKGIVIKD